MCDQRTEPKGVVLHDPSTDELREDANLLVWDKGRFRWLRLRVARGRFVDSETQDCEPRLRVVE